MIWSPPQSNRSRIKTAKAFGLPQALLVAADEGSTLDDAAFGAASEVTSKFRLAV